ncbi:hypothetical protein MY8738_002782 [Beauveria namnaoensis]
MHGQPAGPKTRHSRLHTHIKHQKGAEDTDWVLGLIYHPLSYSLLGLPKTLREDFANPMKAMAYNPKT